MRRALARIALLAVLAGAQVAAAAVIGVTPVPGTVQVGQPVLVDLTISGLGAGGAPSLGVFDIDVSFDPLLLGLTTVTFGDPVLGDQLDVLGLGALNFITPGDGTVNLFELSFDTIDDLNLLQVGAFTLARLSFNSLAPGTALFALNINALGDAQGNALLEITTSVASLDISMPSSQVPEPSTLLLVLAALLGKL